MKELLFENKEIINIIFAAIISAIPTFCDIKKDKDKKGKRRLNWKGWILLSISFAFILVSLFEINQEDKRLKADDIVIKFSLRSLNSISNYEKLTDDLPKEIFVPFVEIEKSRTSGIFKIQNVNSGKGHASESKFINYVCCISGNKSVENFPVNLEDIKPENVIFHFSLKKLLEKGYQLNGSPKLILRDKTYEGRFDTYSEKLEFQK